MSDDTPPPRVPMPVASPRHPMPPRRSDSKEIALDKILQKDRKQQERKPLNYVLIGTVISALSAGVVQGYRKASETNQEDREHHSQFDAKVEKRLDHCEEDVATLRRRFERFKSRFPYHREEEDPP